MVADKLALAVSLPDSELENAYGSFLERLFGQPLWSPENLDGRRIPWWALEAARHQFDLELSSPGLYLFGSNEVPMYIGQTAKLLSRLRKRYTRSKCAQFQLAMLYGDELRARGYEAMPHDVLDWYKKNYGKSRVRLRHAANFAEAGITSVWIALIPTQTKEDAKRLERRLIPIANTWNGLHQLPDLLNIQHMQYG